MKNNNIPKWQKGFRKIPDFIKPKLFQTRKDNINVSVSKKIKKVSIQKGYYSHIGINIINGEINFLNRIIPSKNNGVSSKYNLEIKENVHKDKPTYMKTITIEVPNFGDWRKGSHEIDFEREVYQRSYIKPRMLEIIIDKISETPEEIIFCFKIDRVLNSTDYNFNIELLNDINLLQENVGCFDIYKTNSTPDEYLNTLVVDWEILPQGERENIFDKIIKKLNLNQNNQNIFRERFDFIYNLNPIKWIAGISGLQRYFGALFKDEIVVFENIRYGNAIYIIKENWEELSKKTRIELIKDKDDNVVRIIHSKSWKSRLRRELRKAINLR